MGPAQGPRDERGRAHGWGAEGVQHPNRGTGRSTTTATTGAGLRVVPTLTGSRAQLAPATRARSTRDALLRRMLAVADAVGIVAAMVVVGAVHPPDHARDVALIVVLALPLWVLANRLTGSYHRDELIVHKSTLDELPLVARSVTMGTLVLFFVAPFTTGAPLERDVTLLFLLVALTAVPAARGLARVAWRTATAPERVIVLGSGPVAELVATKLGGHPEYGIELLGYLDAQAEPHSGAAGLPFLGELEDFAAICARERVQRIIIAFTNLPYERTSELVCASRRLGLKVSIVPRLYEVIGSGVVTDAVEGLTVHGLRPSARGATNLALKRAIDVLVASAGLLALSPALLVAALAVKLTSPGPVLFRQERMGHGQRSFSILKLRTMVHDAETRKAGLRHLNEMDVAGPMFKMARDPRITRVGGWLRRTSFDELPQLLNVLRGEMSLVGPRPLVLDEDDHVIGWHRERLDLKPGLTGPWQVLGRNRIPFEEMVKLDYLYVATWSLFGDVKLILRTLPVVLGRRGA